MPRRYASVHDAAERERGQEKSELKGAGSRRTNIERQCEKVDGSKVHGLTRQALSGSFVNRHTHTRLAKPTVSKFSEGDNIDSRPDRDSVAADKINFRQARVRASFARPSTCDTALDARKVDDVSSLPVDPTELDRERKKHRVSADMSRKSESSKRAQEMPRTKRSSRATTELPLERTEIGPNSAMSHTFASGRSTPKSRVELVAQDSGVTVPTKHASLAHRRSREVRACEKTSADAIGENERTGTVKSSRRRATRATDIHQRPIQHNLEPTSSVRGSNRAPRRHQYRHTHTNVPFEAEHKPSSNYYDAIAPGGKSDIESGSQESVKLSKELAGSSEIRDRVAKYYTAASDAIRMAIPESSSRMKREKRRIIEEKFSNAVAKHNARARTWTARYKLRDYDPEDFKMISSPSALWQRMTFPMRMICLLSGFIALYLTLLSTDRASGTEGVNLGVLNATSSSIGLPPAWHAQGTLEAEQRKGSFEVNQPRNYMLESAMQAAAVAKKEMDAAAAAKAKKNKPAQKMLKQASSPGKGSHAPGMPAKQKTKQKNTDFVEHAKESPNASASVMEEKAQKKKKSKKKTKGNSKSKISSKEADDSKGIAQEIESAAKQSSDNEAKENGKVPEHEASGISSPASKKELDPADVNQVANNSDTSESKGPSTPESQPESAVPLEGRDLSLPEEKSDFQDSNDYFKDLSPRDVDDGMYPLLTWNYDKLQSPNSTKHLISLGGGDHVGTFKPVCILPDEEKIVTFPEQRTCGGFNKSAGWMIQYCDIVEEQFDKEHMIPKDASNGKGTLDWLAEQEKQEKVIWLEGVTVLQAFEKSCGNIAHFSGRALLLQHIIENIDAYTSVAAKVQNILILPTFHIMKRFLYPHNYEFWHKSLLRAIIAPANYRVGTLGNFLHRVRQNPFNGTANVQLLHNFTLTGGDAADKGKIVCLRQAVVPSFLKSRYFVNDREYPSRLPSLRSPLDSSLRIPRDSIRLRERVMGLLHNASVILPPSKRIVFLDRGGSRRAIAPDTKENMFTAIREAAATRGFTFEVISFENKPFHEQVSLVKDAGIALGVHGANLVNSMFMPPLSVLFELFPYKFRHAMYEEGGGAGLRYFSYQMQTGSDFKSDKPYRDAAQCIKYDHACKVHYRDAQLDVTSDDLKAILGTLSEAMDWCQKHVPTKAGKQARRLLAAKPESARRGKRKQKRQRKLLRSLSGDSGGGNSFRFRGRQT